MSSEVTLDDFLRALSVVEKSYPGGIPRREIEAAFHALLPAEPRSYFWGRAKAPLLFVAQALESARPGDAFSGPDGELLRAAIEKGLGLAAADAGVLVFGAAEKEAATLESIIAEHAPRVLVLLGALPAVKRSAAARESWGVLGPVSVLEGPALREVRQIPGVKRDFWKELQQIPAKLGAEAR